MNLRYNRAKIKLKSRHFEELQRFSAFSRNLKKSDQISLMSAKIATKFEAKSNFLAFIVLKF